MAEYPAPVDRVRLDPKGKTPMSIFRRQSGRARPILAVLAAPLLLSGCTASMYNAMLGHGTGPKDSPEAMARDTNEILDRFEQYCFSDPARWKRIAAEQAVCTRSYTGRWALLDPNTKWFEALTRGVSTFDATLRSRYPSVLHTGNANGGRLDQSWGVTNYWSWRYLLGDGTAILKADREWDRIWNNMETAYGGEDVKMTLSLHMTHPCLREHPQSQTLAACPAMRDALYASPAVPDPRMVDAGIRIIRAELASVDRTRASYAETEAIRDARLAQEWRESRQATDRGLQQGLRNVLANATVLPAPSAAAGGTPPARPPAPASPAPRAAPPAAAQPYAALITLDGTTAAGTTAARPAATYADGRPGTGTAAGPQAAAQTLRTYQEAIVYCWANRENQPPAGPEDERWICHGPTQKIQVAETLPRALEYAGCADAQRAGRRWPFGRGTVYACGFGREPYDQDVASLYSVPGGIAGQLRTYRCAVPHNGRCAAPLPQ